MKNKNNKNKNIENLTYDILGNALRQNMAVYDDYQAEVALKKYILSGNTKYFTRENSPLIFISKLV